MKAKSYYWAEDDKFAPINTALTPADNWKIWVGNKTPRQFVIESSKCEFADKDEKIACAVKQHIDEVEVTMPSLKMRASKKWLADQLTRHIKESEDDAFEFGRATSDAMRDKYLGYFSAKYSKADAEIKSDVDAEADAKEACKDKYKDEQSQTSCLKGASRAKIGKGHQFVSSAYAKLRAKGGYVKKN